MATQFESAAELDKALEDGSFEDVKPEAIENNTPEAPAHTPEERAHNAAFISLAEVSQAFKAIADEARENGFEDIANQAGLRGGDVWLTVRNEKFTPGEENEKYLEGLNSEVEGFRASLETAKRTKEAAAKEDRVADARESVNEVLEAAQPEQVVEVPIPRVEAIPKDERTLFDISELTTPKLVQEAFGNLLGSSDKRVEKKNIKATLKTFNRQLKEIDKEKRDTSLDAFHDRQRRRQEIVDAAAKKVQNFYLFR